MALGAGAWPETMGRGLGNRSIRARGRQRRTSRDFLKVALQRLTTAEALLRLGITLDAQYIGGYKIDFWCNGLFLEKIGAAAQAETREKRLSGWEKHTPHLSHTPPPNLSVSTSLSHLE